MVNVVALGKKVGKGVSDFFVGGIKEFVKKPSLKTGAGAVLDVLPVGKAGKIAKLGGLAVKGAGRVLKSAIPLTIGAGLTEYAVTGKIPSASIRGTAGILGAKTSPIGALIGASKGLVGTTIPKLIEGIPGYNFNKDNFPNITVDKTPSFSEDLIPRYEGGDVIINTPESPQMQQPSISMPSLSIAGFGGGGSGLGLEALLLLLAGAGGFALGKRKKKKKKKKKKKRDDEEDDEEDDEYDEEDDEYD